MPPFSSILRPWKLLARSCWSDGRFQGPSWPSGAGGLGRDDDEAKTGDEAELASWCSSSLMRSSRRCVYDKVGFLQGGEGGHQQGAGPARQRAAAHSL